MLLDLRPAEQFARGQMASALHLDLWGLSLIDTDEAPLRAFMWMIGHIALWKSLLTSFLFALSMFLTFEIAFDVIMPKGPIEAALGF